MENKNKSKKVLRIIVRTFVVLVIIYLIILIARIVEMKKERVEAEKVKEIHGIRLTMADVDGSRIPPMPDEKINNSTVAGVDTNKNYIRDDVEFFIFDKYKDIKERAAWLQYARSQNLVLLKVDSKETLKAVMEEGDRADTCLTDYYLINNSFNLSNYKDRLKEVEKKIINTNLRENVKTEHYKFMTSSGSIPGDQCDVLF